MRSQPFGEIAFALGERAPDFLALGGARPKRLLMPGAIERLYQIFPAPDFLPMKAATIRSPLFTKFQETLVELDGANHDPALFGGKLFWFHSFFPFISANIPNERKWTDFTTDFAALHISKRRFFLSNLSNSDLKGK